MKFTTGLTSSTTDEWPTPRALFDQLDREFGFQTDVCADESNHKCDHYYSMKENGLEQDWHGVCWMNPPYGKAIGVWLHKALTESRKGATVVVLIPVRTDTRWFRENCMKADEIRFIEGRLKFGEARTCAPFPSAIVIFDGRRERERSCDHTPRISMMAVTG